MRELRIRSNGSRANKRKETGRVHCGAAVLIWPIERPLEEVQVGGKVQIEMGRVDPCVVPFRRNFENRWRKNAEHLRLGLSFGDKRMPIHSKPALSRDSQKVRLGAKKNNA